MGGQDCRRLNELLEAQPYLQYEDWNLKNAARELSAAGFILEDQKEEFPLTQFFDAGAVVYYLKAIPWQVQGFDSRTFRPGLEKIDQIIRQEGSLRLHSHRFIMVARRSRMDE